MSKIGAIVQARTGSIRFPDKIFSLLAGKPLIFHVFNRLKNSKILDEIILATTVNSKDDKLIEWAVNNGIKYYRGSENDVLGRFYEAAKFYKLDIILRITADDPFKDSGLIDLALQTFLNSNYNLISNNNPPTFPEGIDIEIFDFETLKYTHFHSVDPFEREHVTQFMYRNPEKIRFKNIQNSYNNSHLRWTIDTHVDYQMATKIYDALYRDNQLFSYQDILIFLEKFPEISLINSNEKRSAMFNNLN